MSDSLPITPATRVGELLDAYPELEGDELGLIRSSFRPAPLIELLEGQGFRTAVVRSGDSFATFVGRRPRVGSA
jgi:hypothetical protein